MGRVSLTEDYDDRSVISKLNEMDKRVKENTTVVTSAEASAKASAQAAQETADRFAGSVGAVVQNANAQINASKAQVDQAKAEVDETVTTVAQAVQTANNASASAQQSATTVATYDTRLTAVEDADTQNVKLDTNQVITGAKTFKVIGDPIIIQAPDIDGNAIPSGNLYSEIDVRDSEGREIAYFIRRQQANGDANVGMVCKHTRLGLSADISAFVTNDGKTYGIAPTPTNSAPSYAIATKGYVESTDGETNNLVHRSANEKVDGIKEFAYNTDKHIGTHITSTSGYWVKLVKWTAVALRYNVVMTVISPYFRDTNFYGKLMFGCWDTSNFAHLDLISPYNWANRFKVTYDGNEVALWYNNTSGEYKQGINVFIDIELNGTDKSSRAILIPENEQVAENPDWSSFARVLDGTYKGWGA